jgi:hypothetical protein
VPPPPKAHKITLSKGKFAWIDLADFTLVCRFKWYAVQVDGKWWYAATGKGSSIKMQHLILGVNYVDHIDGNGLNNRRSNLRPSSPAENGKNRKKQRGKTSSPFKGVSKHGEKWQASIQADGEQKYLGVYDDPVAAARAYDLAAIKYHKTHAHTNFNILDYADVLQG